MNERNLIVVTMVAAGIAVSCTPYPEQQPQPQPETKPEEEQTVSAEEQQKLKEERRKAAEEAERKLAEQEQQGNGGGDETADGGNGGGDGGGNDNGNGGERPQFDFATPVPGRPGFVFSPFNNKVIDVRDIPSGTLVQDPTYAASEKKYFRVP